MASPSSHEAAISREGGSRKGGGCEGISESVAEDGELKHPEEHSTWKLNTVTLSGNRAPGTINIQVIYYETSSCFILSYSPVKTTARTGPTSRTSTMRTGAEQEITRGQPRSAPTWSKSTPPPVSMETKQDQVGHSEARGPGHWLPLLGNAGHGLAQEGAPEMGAPDWPGQGGVQLPKRF